MQFLTYEEYLEMGGTLEDENKYNLYEFEVEGIIHWYTMDRLRNETEYSEEVKQCAYMLVNLIIEKYATLNVGSDDTETPTSSVAGQIASQSNDGVETTYVTLSSYNLLTFCTKEVNNVINYCLRNAVNSLGRKLLYRGYYPGE